jgi:DNA primase
MQIMQELKRFSDLEEAKFQAVLFAVEQDSYTIKAREHLEAELESKLKESPGSVLNDAYIATLQNFLTYFDNDTRSQIKVERYHRVGRRQAIEYAIEEFGNLEVIQAEIIKTTRRLYALAEKMGEYASPRLANAGYLEALLEAKVLIQGILDQSPGTKNE